MSINVVKDPVMYKNTWRIDNFSELDAESYDSKVFTAEDLKWKIQLYPKLKRQWSWCPSGSLLGVSRTKISSS
ncbi:hypothetical protein ACFX12_012155 [Malus domestica]